MSTTNEETQAFRGKSEYRERLAEILADPVFQLAVSIVKGSAVPKPPSTHELTALSDIVFGRRYMLMSGVNQGFEDLERLTKPIAVGETESGLLAKAFTHNIAPELRETQEKPKC
jgi:hypothetical protein